MKHLPRCSIHWVAQQRSFGVSRTRDVLTGCFRTEQDLQRRAAATKPLVLEGEGLHTGVWQDGNSFVSVKKRLDKRMCQRGHRDEGISLWYVGKGEKVIIRCNPGQTEARVVSAREPRESSVAEAKEVWDQIWKTGEHEGVQFIGQGW